jgi:glycosyltransferase involved in cell wall biosynthesis
MNASAVPVSVVVPCYRCAATLERAVESVAAQTLRPAELILVDDASSDATGPLLQALQARHGTWVKLVTLPANAGAASARNAGWQVATQVYIAFLDSDDAWHPRKIEIQLAYMQTHPDVALCGHLCRQLTPAASDVPWWPVGDQAPQAHAVTLTGLLLRHAFVTPSVMLRRDIAVRFATGVRHMEDHRLWLDIVGAPLPAVKLMAELVAVYKPVYGASGLSADMWRMEKAELANYRHVQGVGKISRLQLMLLQAYSLAKYARRLTIVFLFHRV